MRLLHELAKMPPPALKHVVKNERSSAVPRWAKGGPMGSHPPPAPTPPGAPRRAAVLRALTGYRADTRFPPHRGTIVSYDVLVAGREHKRRRPRCGRLRPGYRREVSSATMSAADCDFLASATPCPAHIESASIWPVVPAIGGAGPPT